MLRYAFVIAERLFTKANDVDGVKFGNSVINCQSEIEKVMFGSLFVFIFSSEINNVAS